MRRILPLLALALSLCLPSVSRADVRALLIACSDFVTQPDLGSVISGNVQMIASALLGVSPRIAGLSIEDGTIGTGDALDASISDAFGDADEDDLSILYLCTHGVLSSSDDGLAYLLLSDGRTETALSGGDLCRMLSPIQGDKLVILDACFSGALIGRSILPRPGLPEEPSALPRPVRESCGSAAAPFLADTSIHLLTSASGFESSWYYDSQSLATGAISYFASALSSGLGLYGVPEADMNGDTQISLRELHAYLSAAVPSSSCQLLSADDSLALPAVSSAMLTRPLSGFSYGESLLMADSPELAFSFTVTDQTAVQYRLIDFDSGKWNWESAKTFLDEGDQGDGMLSPGRKTRTLTLSDIAPGDRGYLMLQVFSLSGEELILCSERLIAVQPAEGDAQLDIACPEAFAADREELCIAVTTGVPAELTVSVFDAQGSLVRRICQSRLTRPAPGDITPVYWDGRDQHGARVPEGAYTVTAEASISGRRCRATADVRAF